MMNPADDRLQPAPQTTSAQPIVPLQGASPMVSGWSAPAAPNGWSSAAVPPEREAAPGVGQIDPIALLKALRRRWMLALPLGLFLGLAAATAVWFVIPPSKYTASARLFVPQAAPRFLYQTKETSSEYHLFRQTQAVRIRSQRVLGTALRRPEVQELDEFAKHEDPEDWLRRTLKIDFPDGAEILEISMSGQDPEALATLVNAVTDAYLNEVVNVDYNARLDRLEKLRTFWKTFKDELLKKRANLRRLAGSVGPAAPAVVSARKQAEEDRQASVRSALIQVQSELMKAETELEALESAPKESNEAPLADDLRRRVNQALDNDPELIARAERINQLEGSYKALAGAARAPSKDAAGVQIRRELEAERKALAERARAIRPAIERAILEEGGPGSPDGLKTLKSQIALMKRLEAKYLDEIDKIKEEQISTNQEAFDLGFLQAELDLDEKAARDMGDEIKHAEIELEQAPPRVQSLETAQVPRVKDKDKRPVMAGAAGLGVFCLIALAIGFLEHQARRITSIDEVADELGLPIVGSIPQLPSPGRSSKSPSALESPRQTLWNNLMIESVDATRTMLLRATQADALRAIMITSANMGEGKSTLAGHLATSLARSGRRVLLIDGDLRRPIAHRVYEIPLAPGFCEWLREEAPFESIIHETAVTNLWMAPAGLCDGAALADLARRDLRPLFDELKRTYDYVIVDSSPVLPVVDATVIGQHVDAAILSVMNERSRAPEVQETFELLNALGVRVLGAVMAGTRVSRRSYYRSPYAYYGVGRDAESFGQG